MFSCPCFRPAPAKLKLPGTEQVMFDSIGQLGAEELDGLAGFRINIHAVGDRSASVQDGAMIAAAE